MNYSLYFLLPVILLISCSPASKNHTQTTSTLNINLPEEPITLDPRKGGDFYSSAMHFLLFDGLTRITPHSSGEYGLAERIDLSDDKLTYTFHLRPALWSNNTPITAYDFEYSWKSILDPAFPAPSANLLYPILYAEEAKQGLIPLDSVGIKALDEQTLVVTLKNPTPYFLNLTSFCVFFPVCQAVVEQHPEWADNLSPSFVSSGPYALQQWKHDDEFLIGKNPLYWDKKEIALERIRISMIGDENTALELFARGELDVLGSPFTNISIDAAESLNEKKCLEAFPVGKTLTCFFNVENSILANKNIRKALSESIDREGIISSIGVLDEIPAVNFVPPVLKQGNNIPLIKAMDIESAKMHFQQGLQELNIEAEDLTDLTLTYPCQDRCRNIAQALQEAWMKHLGIKIELRTLPLKEFLTMARNGQFDLCVYYWIAQYDDPMSILDRFRKKSNPKNYSQWENLRYIELLDASAQLTGGERNQLLQEAEEIIMEEMPIAPIMHACNIRMVQPYVKGLFSSSIGQTHLHKIHLEQEEKTIR
jgi:oligopeptide transport system substrate-binding protein